jgi:C-terminal processing protease CtpA/Prc
MRITLLKITYCFIFFIVLSTQAQKIDFEVDKYHQIGLIYGFMKYHHPEISRGSYDWDSEFVSWITKNDTVKNQRELNQNIVEFLTKYPLKKQNKTKPDAAYFEKNKDYGWIEQVGFTIEIKQYLHHVKDHYQASSYYATIKYLGKQLDFKNENGLPNFDYTQQNHRLLFLFNFWNAIEYWYANKYLMDESWLDLLPIFVEDFINADSEINFELAKLNLISKLNDSHAFYLSEKFVNHFYQYKPPFWVKNIQDTLYVSHITNKILAQQDGIEIGDLIVKINNSNIKSNINENLKNILSASNKTNLNKSSQFLLWKRTDTLNVEILKKDGTTVNQNIHLYKNIKDTLAEGKSFYINEQFKFIKPKIGYLNLSQITKKELKTVFEKFKNTKGIIIDLRNYPTSINDQNIARYLYPQRKKFIQVLFPILNKPALFEYGGKSIIHFIKDPFSAGKNSADYYKGKIILLVDNRTISKSEFIGMAIQNAPNCITVGQQTAGAVMNVVAYKMSDGTEIIFTGLGAFDTKGNEVQRNGLKIDYPIEYNAQNVNFDLYISKAVLLIEQ